jgi:hypothetical protein
MAKQILVPLKRNDRIEEMIPYIKQVAQADTTVVFLIHHPVNGFKWLQAYSAIMECDINNAEAVRRMVESHSAEMNRRLAEQRVFHTCEALRQLGVKIAVEVYTGGLRNVLRSHILNGDVDLIVTKPWIGLRITTLLRESVSLWSVLKQPSFPAFGFQAYGGESTMKLLHPGRNV